MKTRTLIINTALTVLLAACAGGPPDDIAQDESEVVATVVPEAFWGADHHCWGGDPERCIEETKMLVGGCDNRNQGSVTAGGATMCSRNITPYSMVGRLSSGCTGAMISSKHVLTAAHCVTDGEGNRKGNALNFSLAQYMGCPGGCPRGTVSVRRAFTPKRYDKSLYPNTNDGIREYKAYDVAILELENSISGVDHFSMIGSVNIGSKTLYSLGYPGDKSTGTVWHVAGEKLGRLGYSGGATILTDLDGYAGQSGSPVYVFAGGQRRIAGVLVGSTVQDCEDGYVYAPKLTDWMFDNFVWPSLYYWHPNTDTSQLDVWNFPSVPADIPAAPGSCDF